VRRYEGEELPPGSRIAVIANDALGNYAVSTPLLQMLRSHHKPSVLHYFAGTRTEELWMEDKKVDWGFSLHGMDPHYVVLSTFVENGDEQYDLIINLENAAWAKCFTAVAAGFNTFVCGPCLGADGRKDLPFEKNPRGALWDDTEWIASDLTDKYPFLQTPFIGELFCRLAYLEGQVPRYEIPSEPVFGSLPDVLIATSASLPEKLWPVAKWLEVIARLRQHGLTVGLLGAKPSAQSAFWLGAKEEQQLVKGGLAEDLRGKYRLPEVAGALKRAKAVLTLDNGILHLAAAAGTHTVGLFRHGIHRLWAPPYDNVVVLTPGEKKQVADIEVDTVWEALRLAG
jgi:ADP-heptose:LPS heptosyltransferase